MLSKALKTYDTFEHLTLMRKIKHCKAAIL
jgi:hypothetical protein